MKLATLLLAAACATAGTSGQGSYGTVSFKSMVNAGAPAQVLQVQHGRVIGSNVDLREDQGCIRGYWGQTPVNFCREDDGQGGTQKWGGPNGQFKVTPGGNELAVEGDLLLNGRDISLDQKIPLGTGRSWDELRGHPGLVVVASSLSDLSAIR